MKALRYRWGGEAPAMKKIQEKVQQVKKVPAKIIQVVTKPTMKMTANRRVHNPCALVNVARGCHVC